MTSSEVSVTSQFQYYIIMEGDLVASSAVPVTSRFQITAVSDLHLKKKDEKRLISMTPDEFCDRKKSIQSMSTNSQYRGLR